MRRQNLTHCATWPLTLAVALLLPGICQAQDTATPGAVVETSDTAEPVVLNFGRIKNGLALAKAREETGALLRLEYRLSVYGVAPQIQWLQDFDTRNGEVPFGAPTHAEFQNRWLPREFRAPTVPLMPIIRWTFGK